MEGGASVGDCIEFGWTRFVLREEGGEIVVRAPDFERDPFRDTTDDLSLSLEIQTEQNSVLRRIGEVGHAARFWEKIVFARGALQESRIYLERAAGSPADDSGWYIGPVEKMDSTSIDLAACRVSDLLRLRRPLMSVLAVPPGYLVVFDGDAIDAVLNGNDVDVWSPSEGVQ